jgi:hypothetical protein
MAERNEKIFERVVQELEKNPDLGSKELYGTLRESDKAVGKDTLQQFHARYVLPARRSLKAASGGETARRAPRRRAKAATNGQAPAAGQAPRRTRRSRRQEPDRDRIRGLLLQFAQDLTDAESRSNLVQVLARVDSYVDKIAATVVR